MKLNLLPILTIAAGMFPSDYAAHGQQVPAPDETLPDTLSRPSRAPSVAPSVAIDSSSLTTPFEIYMHLDGTGKPLVLVFPDPQGMLVFIFFVVADSWISDDGHGLGVGGSLRNEGDEDDFLLELNVVPDSLIRVGSQNFYNSLPSCFGEDVSVIVDGGQEVFVAQFTAVENFPFTATFNIQSETGEVYNSVAVTIKKEEDEYIGTFKEIDVTVGSTKYEQQYDVDKTETKPVVFANGSPFLCNSPEERSAIDSVWFGQKFSICFEVGDGYYLYKFSNVKCGTNQLFNDSGESTETYTTVQGQGTKSFSFTSVVFQTYAQGNSGGTFECEGEARFTLTRRDLQGVPSDVEEKATFSTFALSIKVGAIDTIAAGSISSIHYTALLVMAVMWGVLLIS